MLHSISMLIQRNIAKSVEERLQNDHRVVIIYGPRQSGKTTLSKMVIEHLGLRTLQVNADEGRFLDILSSADGTKLRDFVGSNELVFIDEAQRIPEIGLNLKIMIDDERLKHVRFLVTGSSSLDLASKVREPLTGRNWSYHLYPISINELSTTNSKFELNHMIEERLLYGSYPGIFSLTGSERKWQYLYGLTADYLYKDILMSVDIRNPEKIRSLLKLLALQIGNEVSLTELARQLELSRDAVARYLYLLEESFVLLRVGGYGRNMRTQLAKKPKYYFFDLGVRNALIDATQPLVSRADLGALWENFLMIERIKRQETLNRLARQHFWRNETGTEIDLIEEKNGKISAYEFKWGTKIAKAPRSFREQYPEAQFKTINRENWIDFVCEEVR